MQINYGKGVLYVLFDQKEMLLLLAAVSLFAAALWRTALAKRRAKTKATFCS
jgi:hypothetical protein